MRCPQLKDCPKNEQMAKKGNIEWLCEILRTNFQSRAFLVCEQAHLVCYSCEYIGSRAVTCELMRRMG